jgi:hypothetical protein
VASSIQPLMKNAAPVPTMFLFPSLATWTGYPPMPMDVSALYHSIIPLGFSMLPHEPKKRPEQLSTIIQMTRPKQHYMFNQLPPSTRSIISTEALTSHSQNCARLWPVMVFSGTILDMGAKSTKSISSLFSPFYNW